MALTDKFWRLVVEGIGRPDIATDPDFIDFAARRKNRDKLTPVLDAVFAERTVEEWLDTFIGKVPIGPVYDLDQALENPFLAERGAIQSYRHPAKGEFKVLTGPIRVDGERMPVEKAPALGQDTEAVLVELGYDAKAITGLRKRGVV
jgi:crotonobetainyl-CoA:carnitine CoA-transferase CaiB-like acyl-CoA transferase